MIQLTEEQIRAEAEEAAKKRFNNPYWRRSQQSDFVKGYIAAASKYLPQGEGWISSNQHPEKNRLLAVHWEGTKDVDVAFFEKGKFVDYQSGWIYVDQPTKWTYLPAPPIDQQDERCCWCGGNGMAELQSAEDPTSSCKHCGGSGIEPIQQKKEEV